MHSCIHDKYKHSHTRQIIHELGQYTDLHHYVVKVIIEEQVVLKLTLHLFQLRLRTKNTS